MGSGTNLILNYQDTVLVLLTIQMPGKKTSKTWDKNENPDVQKAELPEIIIICKYRYI